MYKTGASFHYLKKKKVRTHEIQSLGDYITSGTLTGGKTLFTNFPAWGRGYNWGQSAGEQEVVMCTHLAPIG